MEVGDVTRKQWAVIVLTLFSLSCWNRNARGALANDPK